MTRHYFKIALFLMLSAGGLAGAAGTVASAADSGTGNASAPPVNGIDVAALNGKVTLQVPAAFVNQTREDTTSQNPGVKIQVFTDRQRQQVIGVSEVPTAAGDANDTSADAFNKMAQGSLSGLKTQYKDVQKTGQSTEIVAGRKFLRLDTRQSVEGNAMLGSTITTPYAGNVLTIQVLTPAKNEVQHNRLVKQVLGTVAFH
ncbi:hypothetical protein Sant_0104 [Sodalis praecaptivus]|uniref:Uncharacterized protein n=1 Tax=Sodalis praecaptivus TaxID=1239307 RepID=W0HMV0_9GAMM|nr:hypothetical protein [Sodalis praecaptivus]AHF75221.1 hypothetical protein Sant_0104 [Sodalis praecaptivus]